MSPAIPVRRGPFWRGVGKWVLKLQGWRFEGEMPDLAKFVAIMVPHTSNWDFVFGMAGIFALGIDLRWIGKHTLFRWPFGGIMRWMGGTPVDRKNTKGLVSGTVDLFNEHDQFVVGLSPEGTRKKVTKWKSGFYHIADQAKVPILLLSMDYAEKKIILGPAIETTGDFEVDLKRIEDYYADKRGKHS